MNLIRRSPVYWFTSAEIYADSDASIEPPFHAEYLRWDDAMISIENVSAPSAFLSISMDSFMDDHETIPIDVS